MPEASLSSKEKTVKERRTASGTLLGWVSIKRTICRLFGHDDHVGGLDDGIDVLTLGEVQMFSRVLGDDRDDFCAARQFNDHLGINRTWRDLFYLAFEHITRTDFHKILLL